MKTILLIPGNAKLTIKYLNRISGQYGWLLTPRRTLTKTGLFALPYAVDNECFTRPFDGVRYLLALQQIKQCHGLNKCLFATAPDVVCNAQATLEKFKEWAPLIRVSNFPVALVAQDGLENLTIPWSDLDALFIGGSTEWKLSSEAARLLAQAKTKRKWTHVGRVNSFYRLDKLKVKPDSIDGTHFRYKPDIYTQRWQNEINTREAQSQFDFLEKVKTWEDLL